MENMQTVVENRLSTSYPKILGSKDVKSPMNPRKHRKSVKEVDNDVDYLVLTFGAEGYRPLFRHIAWQLASGTIRRIAGTAKELATNHPIGYFQKLAKQEGYVPPKAQA